MAREVSERKKTSSSNRGLVAAVVGKERKEGEKWEEIEGKKRIIRPMVGLSKGGTREEKRE